MSVVVIKLVRLNQAHNRVDDEAGASGQQSNHYYVSCQRTRLTQTHLRHSHQQAKAFGEELRTSNRTTAYNEVPETNTATNTNDLFQCDFLALHTLGIGRFLAVRLQLFLIPLVHSVLLVRLR